MSTDSIDTDRDTLQRKARIELVTIAAALGAEIPARARKSEIVDMILAGGSTGGNAKSAPSDDGLRADRGGEAPATNGSGGDAAKEDAGKSNGTGAGDSTEAPARNRSRNAAQNGGDAKAGGEATDASDDTSGGRAEGDGGAGAGAGADGDGGRNNAQRNNAQRNNNSNNGNNDARGDDGNRRGRRRRRGRDRDDQPEQWEGEPVEVEGYLDLRDEGYGFLRVKGYTPSRDDVYVPTKMVRQYGLRKGDFIKGASRPQMRNEKNAALLRVDQVADMEPEEAKKRPRFEELTPLFPDVKLRMERPDHPQNMTARIIDIISPVGKGQRGLIVSPPKAGKTSVMKTMAQCIEMNNPEVHLMVLLVDERPEEVTDMRRSVRGEVIGSTFDRPADEHTHVAEVTIERAKRLVELGKDVVIILDGITRLARAYNLAAPATGRIMSGGIDTGALYPPKKFFGAARNVEEGGSLTILATALVDTGSTMDNVIFEEFKGTGNMELRLDRRAAEKRIYPAIDVEASSTRHEELLFERAQLNTVWKLRRVLSGLSADGNPSAALELLIDRMRTFPTNSMFLDEISKAPSGV